MENILGSLIHLAYNPVKEIEADMTVDEFIDLCKKVLIHNGYNIIDSTSSTPHQSNQLPQWRISRTLLTSE